MARHKSTTRSCTVVRRCSYRRWSNLPDVPINHYAQLNLTRVNNVINAVGGVNVTLPETTKAFGHTFPAGVNHLDGRTAIYYARQSSLTEEGRVLRQQSLFRAVAVRLANAHLLNNPITHVSRDRWL